MLRFIARLSKKPFLRAPSFDQIVIFFSTCLVEEKACTYICLPFLSCYLWAIYSPVKTSLSCGIVHYFLNIMYHAIQHPLNVDFNLSSEGKAVHSLLGSDIGKHRFHDSHALRINLTTPVAVDLFKHGFGKIVLRCTHGNIQCSTFGIFAIKTSAF